MIPETSFCLHLFAAMTFTALLLVGGESRRMGRDKATLVVEGAPLWRRQLDLLRNLQPEAIWLSARTRPDWCPPDVKVILDHPPSRGPLSGISAAFLSMSTTHLIVLAVDMPRMTAEHLQKLRDLVEPGRGVVSFEDDMAQPLCAIYPREAATVAERNIASGNASMQSFVRQLRQQNLLHGRDLGSEERALYQNLNTPADIAD
jgi:molybdopterin-guanine dinucleotide biosynthesis protein A